MNALTSILVSGGGASIVTAVVAMLAARGKNKADAASALVDSTLGWADKLTGDNDKLRGQVASLETKVDDMESKLDLIIAQLNLAIPLIDADRHPEALAQIRDALQKVKC